MEENSVRESMEKSLGFELTAGQGNFVRYACSFMNSPKKWCTLILSGYAGTGKTSMVSELLRLVPLWGYTPILMAPTGRAAKVFERMSRIPAFTIHRSIYQFKDEDDSGGLHFDLKQNKIKKGLYIIDEASMISNKPDENGKVLEDLLAYIYQQENSKVIFVGDEGQLPPVGSPDSPALQTAVIASYFDQPVGKVQLKEVVRQSLESGILKNATHIRGKAPLHLTIEDDHQCISARDFPGVLDDSYGKCSVEEVLVVCRSNKAAFEYNKAIRNLIFDFEEEIAPGEMLMAVKNNYYWLKQNKLQGFIANGETLRVERVIRNFELGPFRFAEIEALVGVDKTNITLTLWLNSIESPTPSLPYDQTKLLYQLVRAELGREKGKYSKKELLDHPTLNALQVKYAYAVTCHKAQGGQWKHVFVDAGYYQPGPPDSEYRRWLYTAVTRATEQVYYVQPPTFFFPGQEWD